MAKPLRSDRAAEATAGTTARLEKAVSYHSSGTGPAVQSHDPVIGPLHREAGSSSTGQCGWSPGMRSVIR